MSRRARRITLAVVLLAGIVLAVRVSMSRVDSRFVGRWRHQTPGTPMFHTFQTDGTLVIEREVGGTPVPFQKRTYYTWRVVGDEFRGYEWKRQAGPRLVQKLMCLGDEVFGMTSLRQYDACKVRFLSDREFEFSHPSHPTAQPTRFVRVDR